MRVARLACAHRVPVPCACTARSTVKAQRLDVFDVLVLIVNAAVTAFDRDTVTQAATRGIPIVIVRSKVDRAITNDQNDRGLDAPDMAGVMAGVKAEVVRAVGEAHADSVFVVCGRLGSVSKFDMPAFVTSTTSLGQRIAAEKAVAAAEV